MARIVADITPRTASLLDSEDERVVTVAATALLDRGDLKPHAADERVIGRSSP